MTVNVFHRTFKFELIIDCERQRKQFLKNNKLNNMISVIRKKSNSFRSTVTFINKEKRECCFVKRLWDNSCLNAGKRNIFLPKFHRELKELKLVRLAVCRLINEVKSWNIKI